MTDTTMFSLDASLSRLLQHLIHEAPSGHAVSLPEAAMRWELAREPAYGDLSTAVAFKLAAAWRQSPQQIAQTLAERFTRARAPEAVAEWIGRVEARAGYLNVFLSSRALAAVLRQIRTEGPSFGVRPAAAHPPINIEFVSANPTGPLSVAHGRQAAVGDALARLLRSQGEQVTTEYYVNDEGRQIEMLGRSLRARYLQALGRTEPFPEEGYHGAYVAEQGRALAETQGAALAEAPLETFTALGMEEQLGRIKDDLARFGLAFDAWTSQRWLNTSGKISAALEALQQAGALYESEGARWFASTRYGDDKDRVVRKRDGELTYLAPDIAYHQWKFARGFARVINLWGPDHHGYIARIAASLTALSLPAAAFTVRLVQLVTLSRGGRPVPMSKRQGEFVTFREVLDEVGVDATRFFYLMRTMDSQLDFDLDLAKSQSQDNPVYYVQYAHARICSILAKAEAAAAEPDLDVLIEPEEQGLIRQLYQYPITLRICAAALEPQGITVYLRRLAETFHVFYTKHRVISEDPARSAARRELIQATRQVLANGLAVLGVSAPERM